MLFKRKEMYRPRTYIAACCHYMGYSVVYLLHAGLLLSSFSTQTMEVMRPSETSVHMLTALRYILKDGNIHNSGCEKLWEIIKFYGT
jgi:hypothetical protein